MHNAAYSACGVLHVYDSFQVDSSRALSNLSKETEMGFSSLSYKANVLQMLDEAAPTRVALVP